MLPPRRSVIREGPYHDAARRAVADDTNFVGRPERFRGARRASLNASAARPTVMTAPSLVVQGQLQLFESEPLSMPLVCSTTKNRDIPEARGQQLRCCPGGSAIGFANHHNRLSPSGKFPCPAWQIRQRHIDGTRQVARRRGELLGLTHIDKDNGVAGRKTALQFNDLDPCRRILVSPSE
jgi:hypothetical protein